MRTPSQAFAEDSKLWSDIQDHLPLLFESARGNVLEIGVRGGVSTSALLAGVEAHGGHLWSVDVNNCRAFEHPQWTFIQADSIADKGRVLQEIPEALDLLFVDGDHTYEGCLSDLQTFAPRAKLILIHDVECPDTYPGVRRACEEYAASIGKPLEIRSGSYGLGVVRARFVCPVCFFPGMEYPPQDYHICPCCGIEFATDDCEHTHARNCAKHG